MVYNRYEVKPLGWDQMPWAMVSGCTHMLERNQSCTPQWSPVRRHTDKLCSVGTSQDPGVLHVILDPLFSLP